MEQEPESHNSLHVLMLNLIYPAAHGAGLVWIVSHWAENWDPERRAAVPDPAAIVDAIIAVWLLVYFAISYVGTEKQKDYGTWAFGLDIVETAIIFLCFVLLGYVVKGSERHLPELFALLLFVPLLQYGWIKATCSAGKPLFRLGVLGMLTCAITAFASLSHPVAAPSAGILVLYGLLVPYLRIRLASAGVR